ncbi:hypothetical protein TWF281_004438 [Arthrobotrys megalospora]
MPQTLRGMAGSDLGKSNTCSFHSFLFLPRELRDEIYEHILLTPQSYTPGLIFYNKPYEPPLTNLSILRTSKQVYEEASRVLYSKTIFPIRISRNEARGVNHDTIYYVSQETPWEHLCYRFHGRNGHLYTPNTSADILASKDCFHPNESFPSLSYGNLVRNIRVDVIDNRRFLEAIVMGSASMRLLLLGTERLVHLLGTETQQDRLNMEINVSSRVLEIDAHASNTSIGIPTATNPPILAQSARRIIYEGLIDMIWPLTRGPWKYKINFSEALKKEFPGLLENRLEWCSKSWSGEGREGGVMSGQTPLWDLWKRQHGELKYFGGADQEFDAMNGAYL